VGPLGFRREHLEHNLPLIERIERINQSLTQNGVFPEGENLEGFALFGYAKTSLWILTPGYSDFLLRQTAHDGCWGDRVVRFRLTLDTCADNGRSILQPIVLEPIQ
jgi:hypothetical protein